MQLLESLTSSNQLDRYVTPGTRACCQGSGMRSGHCCQTLHPMNALLNAKCNITQLAYIYAQYHHTTRATQVHSVRC